MIILSVRRVPSEFICKIFALSVADKALQDGAMRPRGRGLETEQAVEKRAASCWDYSFPAGTEDKNPVNYWRLPVPCHVMLFVLIDAVKEKKVDYSFPEVSLAMNIYRRLMNIRDANDRFGYRRNGEGRHVCHSIPL
jgi:hypothetical protein